MLHRDIFPPVFYGIMHLKASDLTYFVEGRKTKSELSFCYFHFYTKADEEPVQYGSVDKSRAKRRRNRNIGGRIILPHIEETQDDISGIEETFLSAFSHTQKKVMPANSSVSELNVWIIWQKMYLAHSFNGSHANDNWYAHLKITFANYMK